MIRNQARNLYQTMVKAIWPHVNHPPEASAEWIATLEELNEEDAESAVRELRLSLDFFPSFAQFHEAITDARILRVQRMPLPQGIEGPIDRSGRARCVALVEWLSEAKHEPITAKTLDELGIEHWRGRLADAYIEDWEHGTGRKNHDLAWTAIRDEIGLPPLALPDGTTYP